MSSGRLWLPVSNTGQRIPGNTEAVNVGTGEIQHRPIEGSAIETRPVAPAVAAAPAPVPLHPNAATPAPAPAPVQVAQQPQAVAAPQPVQAAPAPAATYAPPVYVAPVQPAPGPNLELAALQEKLSFYEAFDQLINDNVQRSAQLFRSLYEERERMRGETSRNRAEVEAAAALEAERRLAGERERMQSTLMSLMDEASRMQRQVDGLIQKIAEAITEFTVWLPNDHEATDQRHAS